MSRIGKKPITIPSDVTIDVRKGEIRVRGKRGELSYALPTGIQVETAGDAVRIMRSSDGKEDRALHGLARSLVANMVTGVSQGFQRVLELKGVGYRAQRKGNALSFTLGYSHPIEYTLPEGVDAVVDDKQTTITISGQDKQVIGQVAAKLRELRTPDVYKGKGVRYSGERLKLKAGKTGKK